MTRLSNASDVTDVNSAALSAVQNNPTIDGTLNNRLTKVYNDFYQTHRDVFDCSPNTPGWYRIIKLQHSIGDYVDGAKPIGLKLHISRAYGYGTPETHYIGCNIVWRSSKFYNIASMAGNHMITKIRHCIRKDLTYAAFDIYYDYTNSNNIWFVLDTFECQYITKSVPVTLVPETSDTEDIVSIYDIPANAYFTS